MLSQPKTVDYLLSEGLLSPAEVVEDVVSVVNVSRRHHNFCVTNDSGRGFLIKQGVGKERAAAVAHEATVYQRLGTTAAFSSRYLPDLHRYDTKNEILVLEWIEGGQNLREYHAQRGSFPVLPARALGDALSRLHQLPVTADNPAAAGRGGVPWVFSLHSPDAGFFHQCSAANLSLISMVQEFPEYCDHLRALAEEWSKDALIHGDLKWDNCLATGKTASARKTRVRIVDWELARAGDPCWDTGSIFQEYLGFWLLSFPITGYEPPERFLDLARFPLERMHPGIRTFWETYSAHMGFSLVEADRQLIRAIRFAGARLLQTAFEQMQHSSQLNGNIICFLQLSLNILERPREAAAHLLDLRSQGLDVYAPV